ncbi:hypothetical protein NH340_JMT06356 [Sarcoptes scabiei]|nr:hypothetical protein NH340_JMT06356 [Sarcoptes scabiei]
MSSLTNSLGVNNLESDEIDFGFPYKPYKIQTELMATLYRSFQDGLISIVESPTGTGKSLSIICALSKWLEDFKAKEIESLEKEIQSLNLESEKLAKLESNNDDWIQIQSNQIRVKSKVKESIARLEKITKHIRFSKDLRKKSRSKLSKERGFKGNKFTVKKRALKELEDESVDDIDLNDDNNLIIDEDYEDMTNEKNDQQYFRPKIFYCSRTHSQLSQFVNEFKKTKYFTENNCSMMLVPLSSRINYCVNPSLKRLNNLNMINENCNELRSSKTKRCLYYDRHKMKEFSETILSEAHDIEELATVGYREKVCPYYSAKIAIPDAEIVVMPYQMLLHQSTRENFDLNLQDSIVIVDEAHNLLETIVNVHTISLKRFQLANILNCISLYMAKYFARFNSKNLRFLKQLIFVLKKILQLLDVSKNSNCFNPLEMCLQLKIENINHHELIQFIEKSRINLKLQMFSRLKQSKSKENQKNEEAKRSKTSGIIQFLSKMQKDSKLNEANQSDENQEKTSSKQDEASNFDSDTFYLFKDFLVNLNNYTAESRVLLNIDHDNPSNSSIKYLLLSPSIHFKDVVEKCRSVILCGGTMKPFDDYINQLYKPLKIPNERVLFRSFDHVITDDKLLAFGFYKGPNNIALNYSYSNRNSLPIIKETGQVIIELVEQIPKGIVVFFPSYDYQDLLLQQWENIGIIKILEKKNKKIFKEPKKSSSLSTTLNQYSRFIGSSPENSAILFSVMGGKMSEGINFSDDLGRGVIVIGLPYANRNSLELTEKINHMNRIEKNAGNEYYENLCMRSVNQSIGRAIRHRNDYATIIMLDERYGRNSIQSKLSDWIHRRFEMIDRFDPETRSKIKDFFDQKKQ